MQACLTYVHALLCWPGGNSMQAPVLWALHLLLTSLPACLTSSRLHLCLQRDQLDSERERLRNEFEQLIGQQQERAADWEAAAKQEEAGMAHRKKVGGRHCLPSCCKGAWHCCQGQSQEACMLSAHPPVRRLPAQSPARLPACPPTPAFSL